MLMGKNTFIKRCMRIYFDEHGVAGKKWEAILEFLVGNVGIIFTEGDLATVHAVILKFKKTAPARVGAIATCDVIIPSGNTGVDATDTSFFTALNIFTKINKGAVEIISDKTVIKSGERVGKSASNLLNKMKIKPFSYGLLVIKIFEDGVIYDSKILGLNDEDLEATTLIAVKNIAALSMALHIPTLATVPFMVLKGYKNILATALATEYDLNEILSRIGLSK